MSEPFKEFHGNLSELEQKNLALVRQRWPWLVSWLEEHQDAREQAYRVVEGQRFSWLVNDEIRMVDSYFFHPEDLDDKRRGQWGIYGMGAGGALFDLVKKAQWHVMKIFVFEDDPILWWTVLATFDFSVFSREPRLFFFADMRNLRTGLQFEGVTESLVHFGMWPDTVHIVHKGEYEHHRKRVSDLLERVREMYLLSVQALGNSAEDTLMGFRQMVSNLPGMMRSLDFATLQNFYRDVPAIIVGAGPSLDKNVDLLHEVQNKALIIATDAVTKKLLNMGIRPHITACLEREELNYLKYYRGIDNDVSEVLLVPMTVCVPEMAATWRGPCAFFFKVGLPLEVWFSTITKLPQIRSGASVSNICYTLALLLGCRTIALIGQDLAFGEDRRTHADGAGWDGQTIEEFKQIMGRVMSVPGALGGEVLTDQYFALVKRIFEDSLESDRKNLGEIRLVDATEGGALIQGTEVMPFRDFLDEWVLSREPMEKIPAVAATHRPLAPQEAQRYVQERMVELQGTVGRFREMVEKISAAADRIDVVTLTPMQRRRMATEVMEYMDRLVAMSPVLTFIVQSHVVETSTRLLRFRMLDTREEARQWMSIVDEFVRAEKVVLDRVEEMAFLGEKVLQQEDSYRETILEVGGEDWGPLDSAQALALWRRCREEDDPLLAVRLCLHHDGFPGVWPAEELLILGRMLLSSGWVRFARKVLSSILQASGNEEILKDSTFFNDLGVAYLAYELGADRDFNSAAWYFAEALRRDPENETSVDNFIVFEHLVQSSAACFSSAKENRWGVSLVFAESLARLQLWEKALPFFLELLANEEKWPVTEAWQRGKILCEVAMCHESLGHLEEAAASYRRAVEADPKNLPYQWEEVRFYLRRKDRENGLRLLRTMLRTLAGTAYLAQRKDQLWEFSRSQALPWLENFLQEIFSKGFVVEMENAQESVPKSRE